MTLRSAAWCPCLNSSRALECQSPSGELFGCLEKPWAWCLTHRCRAEVQNSILPAHFDWRKVVRNSLVSGWTSPSFSCSDCPSTASRSLSSVLPASSWRQPCCSRWLTVPLPGASGSSCTWTIPGFLIRLSAFAQWFIRLPPRAPWDGLLVQHLTWTLILRFGTSVQQLTHLGLVSYLAGSLSCRFCSLICCGQTSVWWRWRTTSLVILAKRYRCHLFPCSFSGCDRLRLI